MQGRIYFKEGVAMPSASILIKPASSICNIACKYCFYHKIAENRENACLGIMSGETLETLVREVIDYADDYAAFAFQGGEPCAAGLDYFRKAVELQKKYNTKGLTIENTIQTNGLLINKEWAQFFAENRFLVGLSIDGPKDVHDKYRVDPKGDGTFDRVMQTAGLLKRYGVDVNILTVVTEFSAKKAKYLYSFYKRNGFMFVQLIPCMDEDSRFGGDRSEYAVTPRSYGKFLCDMFDMWYEDFRKGYRMDIRMFSNLAQMSVGYPAEQCGMNGYCTCYFVVEGDGSVYPCDFYCMDEYMLGTVGDGFGQMLKSGKAEQFVECSKPIAAECLKCPHLRLCRGGCRRWREPFEDGKPSLNRLCGAYKMFFAHTSERIHKLGRTIVEPGYKLDQ